MEWPRRGVYSSRNKARNARSADDTPYPTQRVLVYCGCLVSIEGVGLLARCPPRTRRCRPEEVVEYAQLFLSAVFVTVAVTAAAGMLVKHVVHGPQPLAVGLCVALARHPRVSEDLAGRQAGVRVRLENPRQQVLGFGADTQVVQPLPVVPRRLDVGVQVLAFHALSGRVRLVPRQHLVDDAPQRPHVGLRAVRTVDELRRVVRGRAPHLPQAVVRLALAGVVRAVLPRAHLHQRRQAKVRDLHLHGRG